MTRTAHAQQRMQQRAIPPEWIEVLMCFGVEVSSGRGFDRLTLPRRDAEQLRQRLKGLLSRWDHLVDAYAVVSRADVLVTTAHRTTKPRRSSRPHQPSPECRHEPHA